MDRELAGLRKNFDVTQEDKERAMEHKEKAQNPEHNEDLSKEV